MLIIIKVLTTVLVSLIGYLFFIDTIKYFKQKEYTYISVGIVLIVFIVYYLYRIWTL